MNDLLQPPSIEPLPSVPLLERFLFEQPVLPVAFLALLAIIVIIVSLSRSRSRSQRQPGWGWGQIIAGVLLLVAAGIYLTASLVTTQREVLMERTEAFIESAAQAQIPVLREILTEDASLRSLGNLARVLPSLESRAGILDRVERTLKGRFLATDWKILDRQATLDGPNVGRTLIRVGVDIEGFSRTQYSWWRLHWERGPDGTWRCFELEPLWIQFAGSA